MAAYNGKYVDRRWGPPTNLTNYRKIEGSFSAAMDPPATTSHGDQSPRRRFSRTKLVSSRKALVSST